MRSLLFVPAHDARKCEKALASAADALILDLEDAVPDASKSVARRMCAAFTANNRGRKRLFVRINGLSRGFVQEDLDAVVAGRPDGIMLPKCGEGADVARLGDLLTAAEAREGIQRGAIQVLPIVTETAASLFGLGSYASHAGPRLCGMFWGGEDLAADIGALANRDAAGTYTAPYQLARALTLLGAASAGVAAVDAVYPNFRDIAGLRVEALQAVRDGFTAKVAVHPDQVGPINEAFTPTDEQASWARRVIEAFEAAPTAGAIALDGVMLDRPHLRSAQRVIDRCKSSL